MPLTPYYIHLMLRSEGIPESNQGDKRAMTEEEKRKLALEIFTQEQARLQNGRVFIAHNARIQTSLARSEKQHRMMTTLAQNGITWGELKSTFD